MIYLLLDSSGFGGIESHVLQLARLLKAERQAVTVVFIRRYADHPMYQQLNNAAIPVQFLSPSSPIDHFAYSFAKQVTRGDVLHAHGYKASILARLLGCLTPSVVVTTFHAGESPSGRIAFYEWLNRVSSFMSRNLAVSKAIQYSVPGECELLANFVSVSQTPKATHKGKSRRLQVGFVGRLCAVKGIDRFLWLAAQNSDCDYHVFGDGEDAALLSSIEALSDDISIQWHGRVDDMTNHWHTLDILLMPSRAEGLPMAALEAMSHGVITIATDAGDLVRLLPNDCIVAQSKWQALADMIKVFDNDKALALDIALKQQQRIKDAYSCEARWPQLKAIYQRAE
ncbi:glycosyltransferase family 4 protein [Photobacterium swingsii]|uniref:glycosyltransferase family 4 protein n=1 Tax=Photobacterium swingsii TaxID=680026 RepID=UPI0035543D58